MTKNDNFSTLQPQFMKIFYKVFFAILTGILPLFLVFYSFTFNLDNAELHKHSLDKGEFYSELSTKIPQTVEYDLNNAHQTAIYLTFNSLESLLDANFLKKVSNNNIDLITDWLGGKTDELSIYLPVAEIDKNLSTRIDEEVTKLVEKEGASIPSCTSEQTNNLIVKGFTEDQPFCLSETVKSGEIPFTKYLTGSDIHQQGLFNQIFKDSAFDTSAERFQINDVKIAGIQGKDIQKTLNTMRDIILLLEDLFIPGLIIIIFLLIGLISLGILSKISIKSSLRSFCFRVGVGTLTWVAITILTFSGLVYFNFWANDVWFNTNEFNEITKLFTLATLRLTFGLVSYAFWIGLSLIVTALLLKIFDINLKRKNKKIKNYHPDYSKAKTFDAEFHNQAEEIKADNPLEDDYADAENYTKPKAAQSENSFNTDELPEKFEYIRQGEKYTQESEKDPDLNNSNGVENLDYRFHENGENSEIEIGDYYNKRIDQETLETIPNRTDELEEESFEIGNNRK